MHKATAVLVGTVALMLVSPLSVKAIPLGPSVSSPDQSPIEKIGCSRAANNETCPYGYRIKGHGCEPCWKEKHGSRYRDWDERYYEPRRYRDYDHGYYEPRKYPRGYY